MDQAQPGFGDVAASRCARRLVLEGDDEVYPIANPLSLASALAGVSCQADCANRVEYFCPLRNLNFFSSWRSGSNDGGT